MADWGIRGDAHAGPWHRQISLLASESIAKIRARGLNVRPGAFAENITTFGVDITDVRIGDRLAVGVTLLEITQLGKECHNRCAIYFAAGDCVMPREGIFARVLIGGGVRVGDAVQILHVAEGHDSTSCAGVNESVAVNAGSTPNGPPRSESGTRRSIPDVGVSP
ncbi:MAG: MOSC domain-containing protein [Candidatus Zixiibacteriota bacterium]